MAFKTSGSLTTATKTANGTAVEITTDATVPTNTSISLTVNQDESGGTTADNTETINVADGTTTTSLSNFTIATGSSWWLTIDLSTSDDTVSPTFKGATLSLVDSPTPSDLQITDSSTPTEQTLSWDEIQDVSGYNLYRSESSISGTGDATQIANLSSSTNTGTTTIENGFEDMSVWIVENGGQASDRVYEGSNSYYSNQQDSTEVQAYWTPFPNGNQPDVFTFYYQETSDSSGGGIRFVNSNGNYEGGVATNNPQFDVDFANTTGQVNAGGNYDEWVEVTCDFNWSNGEVTVSWEGLSSGNTHSGTYILKQGVDISTVELWNYSDTWGQYQLEMWWDGLSFETTTTTTTPAPSSYTDTGLEDGEKYYYRVSSYVE